MPQCYRCSRSLSDGEGKPIPFGFKILASAASAMMHGGAFLFSEFSQDYCASCRRWLSLMSLVLALLVLGIAALVLSWAAREGFVEMALKYWFGK